MQDAKQQTPKPLYLDMIKYGFDCFTIELIEECPDEKTMFKREILLIKALSTLHPIGYNIRGTQLTEEQAAMVKFNVFGWTAKQYAEYFGLSVPSIRRVRSRWGPFNHLTRDHLPEEFRDR